MPERLGLKGVTEMKIVTPPGALLAVMLAFLVIVAVMAVTSP